MVVFVVVVVVTEWSGEFQLKGREVQERPGRSYEVNFGSLSKEAPAVSSNCWSERHYVHCRSTDDPTQTPISKCSNEMGRLSNTKNS